jgi:hypothetical protein
MQAERLTNSAREAANVDSNGNYIREWREII